MLRIWPTVDMLLTCMGNFVNRLCANGIDWVWHVPYQRLFSLLFRPRNSFVMCPTSNHDICFRIEKQNVSHVLRIVYMQSVESSRVVWGIVKHSNRLLSFCIDCSCVAAKNVIFACTNAMHVYKLRKKFRLSNKLNGIKQKVCHRISQNPILFMTSLKNDSLEFWFIDNMRCAHYSK